ncbi:MAG: hypothetical protein ACNFW9_02715 [Candidatus Kerfeldbacteria bacterium]
MQTKNQKDVFLAKWIKKISKNKSSTELGVKKHIIKHAKEIFKKDPKLWAASMRNMVEIFEAIYHIKPSSTTQIERLEHKYNKNKSYYTTPPKK